MNAMPDAPALDAGRLLACEAIVRCSTSPNAALRGAGLVSAHTCTKHEPGSLGCHRHHGCRCAACATEARRARKRSGAGLTALTDATPAKAHLTQGDPQP